MQNKALVKILAVDDETAILSSLRKVLVDTGCIVVTVESGAEGLAVLQHGRMFDVIISDYRMPGMNGIEFLAATCELQPDSFRILLTGVAPGKDIIASLKSGVISTHIPKPCDSDVLLAVVNNWIADNIRGKSYVYE